jgi:hypothetical protein
VFARVRSVRRRRTAGVVTLAAAAVVAVAVAAGNLTDIDSSPPVTGTPGAPTTVVTGPPTVSPTTPPTSTRTPAGTRTGNTPATTAGPATGSTAGTTEGTTPGKETTTTTTPPSQSPIDVDVKLTPTISGRTVTMNVTVSGTVVRPTTSEGQALPADTSFLNLSGGTNYTWGDGINPGGSDAGAVTCEYSKKRTTGRETYAIDSHTYTKPGTYTFHYTVSYCGTDRSFETSKTTTLVIK